MGRRSGVAKLFVDAGPCGCAKTEEKMLKKNKRGQKDLL